MLAFCAKHTVLRNPHTAHDPLHKKTAEQASGLESPDDRGIFAPVLTHSGLKQVKWPFSLHNHACVTIVCVCVCVCVCVFACVRGLMGFTPGSK